MILVAGSTGLLGLEICRSLRSREERVRGMVREDSPRRDDVAGLGVETVTADLKDPGSLADACRGVATVISTVNSVGRKVRGDGLATVDRAGQAALVLAARQAGVRRFVYLSVSPGSADCPFVRIKREIETAVRESFPEWAILMPAAFMEIWLSAPLGWDFARGRARIFGSGTRPSSFVSVQDVAACAVRAATGEGLGHRNLPIGGPEAVSPLDIVRLAESVLSRKMKVRHVPLPILRAGAFLLLRSNPMMSSLLSLGVKLAEEGETVETPGGVFLPPSRVTVRDFLDRIRATLASPQPAAAG